MAQIAKLEVQAEIKSSADKFYEIFRSKAFLLPKISPEKIQDIQVIKGDWETVGSVKLWTFDAGNSEVAKEYVEAIDEQNKSITFSILEGDITKHYKTFKSTVQVTKKGEAGLVNLTLEYEKQNEDVPVPDKYAGFVTSLVKDIDAYLLKP